jgi:hypothetical protein
VAHCDASYRCACADGEQHLPLPVCCPCSTIVYRAVHLSISYYSNTTFVEIMCGRTQCVGFAGPLCEMDIDECASVRRKSTPFAVQSFSLHLASSLSRQMITHFYVRNEILFHSLKCHPKRGLFSAHCAHKRIRAPPRSIVSSRAAHQRTLATTARRRPQMHTAASARPASAVRFFFSSFSSAFWVGHS